MIPEKYDKYIDDFLVNDIDKIIARVFGTRQPMKIFESIPDAFNIKCPHINEIKLIHGLSNSLSNNDYNDKFNFSKDLVECGTCWDKFIEAYELNRNYMMSFYLVATSVEDYIFGGLLIEFEWRKEGLTHKVKIFDTKEIIQ